MEEIKLELDKDGMGAFYAGEKDRPAGKMFVGVHAHVLTVYHTEVRPEAEGTGLAKKLLETMMDYIRKHNMKVMVFCPYVLAQFNRHPEKYADIWIRREGQ